MKKYLLFPFLSADYRAAEAWLNEQAAKGLRLVKLSVITSISIWEETDAPRRRYAVALWPAEGQSMNIPPALNRNFEEFAAFAAGVGWRYVDCRDFMRIFEAEPGTDPAPLYTDPETELAVYRGLVVRRAWITVIFVLCAYAIFGLISLMLDAPQVVLSRNAALVFLLGIGFLTLLGGGMMGYFALRLRRDRQAAREGRALSVSPVRRAYRLGTASLGLGLAFALLLTAGALADYLYCPGGRNSSNIFLYTIAAQTMNHLLRRKKGRFFISASVVLALGAGILAYAWTHQPEEYLNRYRSPVLAYQDHYALTGYGLAVRRNHYESKLDWMTDGIYDSIRKKEDLADMPPPEGFGRMAVEQAEDGNYDTVLLTWEGNAVLLKSVGMKGPLPLDTMLGCALREPGDAIS